MAETAVPRSGGPSEPGWCCSCSSGAATGALLGASTGAILWPDAPVAPVVLAALALDAAGRPAPLGVGRQVPQLWGRILAPEVAAVLYGARLGVGPANDPHLVAVVGRLRGRRHPGPGDGGPGRGRLPRRPGGRHARRRRAAPSRACRAPRHDRRRPRAPGGRLLLRPRRRGHRHRCPTPTSSRRPAARLRPRPEGAFVTGRLDLDTAASAEVDATAERAVLETRGFVAGEARAWTGPDDDTVYAAVYEFATPAGAAAYLADGRELLLARRVASFPVDEPPGAFGFTQVDETGGGAFVGHAVAFVEGARYFLLIVGGDGSGRTADEARDVARREPARSSA